MPASREKQEGTMNPLTLPAFLTLATIAAPVWSLPVAADDAHHAQGTPPAQKQSQSIPAPSSAQSQAPVPQTPQAPGAQEPATGHTSHAPGQAQPGQMQGGMMMNCPMMQGQMMQMMQGMMQMMQTMQAQMQMMQGQMQGQTPGQMSPGQTGRSRCRTAG
jgi:hypothetical protein